MDDLIDDSSRLWRRLKAYWPLALLLVLTLLVYSPVIGGPFSPLDDVLVIRNNPRFTDASWETFRSHFTSPIYRIYAPLTMVVWHLIALISVDPTAVPRELRPLFFKIAAVVFHAGATGAAFWMALRLLGSKPRACIAAGFFALHPFQAESVGWTMGLRDILCGLLSFATIASYLTFIENGSAKSRRWSVVFYVLAIASKPTAVPLPAVLVAADLMLARRTFEQRVLLFWPFAAAAAVGAVVILNVQNNSDVRTSALALRPLLAADSLSFYVFKTFWPFHFAIDYGRTYAVIRESGALWWTWLLPTAVTIFVALRRDVVLWLGWILFIVPLSPVLGLVRFDMQQYSNVADHYVYQSLLGAGLMFARLLPARRAWSMPAGVVVLIALAILSVGQVLLWRDMNALLRHSLAINPNSFLVYGNLSVVAFEKSDFAAAETFSRQSVAMQYRDVSIDQLAMALEKQGKWDEALWWNEQSLDLPVSSMPLRRIRQIYEFARQRQNIEVAEKAARRWIELDPSEAFPRQRLREIEAARLARRSKEQPKTVPSTIQ